MVGFGEQDTECLEDVVGEKGLAAHADDGGGVSAKRAAGAGVDLAFMEASATVVMLI